MRVLLTGATGFAARYLVPLLLEEGNEVIGTDLTSPDKVIEKHNNSIQAATLDVTDREQCVEVVQDLKPDLIYHLGAITFVPDAERDFDLALKVNVQGVDNICNAVQHPDLEVKPRLLFVGSGEVYGTPVGDDLPFTERSALRPTNNYSLSKAMAEMVVQRHTIKSGVKAVTARPFNHIGPGQRDSFVVSNFAKQLAGIAKGEAEPVLRVGNLSSKRDFSDVRDVVRAYHLLATKGKSGETYNICSGNPVSIEEVLNILIEVSGLDVKVEKDPERFRASDVPLTYGSNDKLRDEIGWAPQYQLREGIELVYKEWLEQ